MGKPLGYSRQEQGACDHDFQPQTTITPFGILLPESGENHLWFSESKVTADFMADRIEEVTVQTPLPLLTHLAYNPLIVRFGRAKAEGGSERLPRRYRGDDPAVEDAL
jgi:hypothetical protein